MVFSDYIPKIGDKPFYMSMTFWGVALLAVEAYLNSLQAVFVSNVHLNAAVAALGVVLTGLGLRRAVGVASAKKK